MGGNQGGGLRREGGREVINLEEAVQSNKSHKRILRDY